MILKTLTVLAISAFVYSAAPHPEVAKFFKLDSPEATIAVEKVNVPAPSATLATAPLTQPQAETPKPTCDPATQWVRADNGECIDKPAETPPAATPHVPVTTEAAGSGSCDLAYNYNWPARTARAICLAESGGNAGAANWNDHHGQCSGSFSLMQVGCFWYPYYGYSASDYYNGSVNMAIAYKIWERQGGFGAWTTYTSGKYQRYY